MTGKEIFRGIRAGLERLFQSAAANNNPDNLSGETSAAHMEAMFRQDAIGICHIAPGGHILRANQKICDIIGLTPDEAVGSSVWETTFTHDIDRAKSEIHRMLEGKSNGFQMENRYEREDGKWFYTRLDVSIARDGKGKPLYSIAILEDITEWKETQRLLRRGSEQTQIIIDALPIAVALIDQNAKVQYFNKMAKDWYGVENADVKGRHYRELVPSNRLHGGEILRHWAEKVEPITFNERVAFGDGKSRDVQMSVIPHVGDVGNLLGAFIMSLDMTEQKETMRQLVALKEKAEAASQAKSDFLATMSHEIRTPMNGVLGMLQLLLAGDLSQEDQEKADLAHESALALMEVLNDILDFSRIESGRLEISKTPFDLCGAIQKLVDGWTIRAHDRGLELRFSAATEIPRTLLCDGGRLRQVLTNLVENAIKFTDEGGISIEISAAPHDDGELMLRFGVTDTGIGIEPEQMDNLFQQFSQVQSGFNREYEGTGLGLAISKSLTELMGGRIGVESTPGQGTTFWFEIPCGVPDSERKLDGILHNDAQTESARGRILIAEDHPVNQQVVKALLAPLNADFVVVDNGKDAVEAIADGDFDLVLMDVRMPIMDGVTAIRVIRAAEDDSRNVPIIAITANAMRGDKDRYIAAGANGYVSKPIDGRELMSAIERVAPNIDVPSRRASAPAPTPLPRPAESA